MSSTISKRQQARNERVLQDLVSTVPGNNFCADCSAPNPSWASWSLGVFLCMRCAAIHRKLGTHISKVKSLSMDSWSNEQVENMRKVGNRTSNRIYNPENLKPSVPIDADEADSAMERFIRQKYMNNSGTSARSSSTRLDEGSPPPLPPKGPAKFGMRSASSIFPLGSKSKKQQAAALNSIPSPHLANKPSKVFGASVDSSTDDTERKLSKLRDMGFADAQRNAAVLKGVNGNLDRAIETLVRLGEGSSRAALTSSSGAGLRPSRSLTPLSPSTPATTTGFGLSVDPPHTPASTTSSNNPFDLAPAPPQSSQSTGTMQNKNPYAASTNPFGQPQQLSDFDQAFQNMSIAPTRPLFPNHTGGATTQGAAAMTGLYATQVPPVPPTPSQYMGMSNTGPGYAGFPQQPAAPLSAQNTGYNPFLTQQATGASQPSPMFPPQMQQPQMSAQVQMSQQMAQPQQNLTVSTQPYGNNHASNPFMRSPTRIQSPALGQIQESQQSMFYAGQPVASPAPVATNPFFAGMAQGGVQQPQIQQQQQPQPAMMRAQTLPYGQVMPQQQAQQPFFQQQQQQHQQQFAPKPTKDSILALYNYPQLAPQPTGIPQQQQQMAALQQPQPQQQQQPRSASSPLTGSNNPFSNMGAPAPISSATVNAAAVSAKPAGSRESIALGMEMAWSNGRHSPDAFAGLSARQ